MLKRVSDWFSDSHVLNTGYRLALKRFRRIDESDPIGTAILRGELLDLDEGETGEFAKLEPVLEVVFVDVETGLEHCCYDVGVGISQVLPVAVAAADTSADLVAIEEPESHAHPTLQAGIADILINGAVADRKKCRIVETQSMHMLLRFQRRIREATRNVATHDMAIGSDDVGIYYLQRADQQTDATQIEIDDSGEMMQPWPDDFLEQDFHDRFA